MIKILLIGIGIPLLLIIILWKKRSLFKLPPDYFERDYDDLSLKYLKFVMLNGILSILLWPVLGVILCKGFIALMKIRIGFLDKGIYVFYDTLLGWIMISTFLGYILSYLTIFISYKLILKNRFDELVVFYNLYYKFNFIRLMKYVTLFSIIILMVFAGLYFDQYTVFAEDYIIVNPMWSLIEHRFEYTDIEKIILAKSFIAPNGNQVDRDNLIIYFNNGLIWDAYKSKARNVKGLYKELADFVEMRSQKRILYYEVLR